jgi:predicted DNA-binding transcriptional regulator YafY
MNMRADRLLSILLLLQAHGRMTAGDLALELEVSERTILRDVTALSTAGIPIFTLCGPGGGIELVENYRTSLTGLTESEIQALFTVSMPQPLEQLGLVEPFRAALRKLSASLPVSHSQASLLSRQRIHLDPVHWLSRSERTPFLSLIYQGLLQERMLHIIYQGFFDARLEMTIAPYGLVSKAGEWQLVGKCQDHMRVLRVAYILQVEVLEQDFQYPLDFVLERFWTQWLAENTAQTSEYPVKVRCKSSLLPVLESYFGVVINPNENKDTSSTPDGWLTLSLPFSTFFQARRRIMSWGGDIEVLDPLPLRLSVRDFAQQIIVVYL